MRVHLDTDFLVLAVMRAGDERRHLETLVASDAEVGMSAVAWYEFTRGPRTPEQLAVAALFLEEDDVVPFTEPLALRAAALFRALGNPRRRGNDVAIAATAIERGATLWTANRADFDDVPGLLVGP